MKILIQGGRVINPKTKTDQVLDVLIIDDHIAKISEEIEEKVDEIIEAKGCWVVPGLIDMHVHLREPGLEYKETIQTGSLSAARGGFTTICAMPNTKPVVDNEIVVQYINNKAKEEAVVHVLPVGAITKEQKGEELANIGLMAKEGICAISEDGGTVKHTGLMQKAMTYANMYDLPILCHCEDIQLAGSGVVHAGEQATILGLKGIPREAEDIMVARDVILAKNTKSKTHICHVSTQGSVDIIRQGKKQGVKVTAEVCPHHFALTDEDIKDYDTNMKMNPPLRTHEDVEALKQGLVDGTIDVIATDHAPHSEQDKKTTFDDAPFGIIGLETAVSLAITCLVNEGILSPMALIEKMSLNPANILGLNKGTIEEGKVADITIIQPDEHYTIDVNQMVSKSKNSPYHGKEVTGKVKYTLVDGKVVYKEK